MSLRSQLKFDINKWSHNPKLTQFTKQLNGYEKRVSTFVKDFDVKSRKAKERSKKQLDKFLGQVKKTRSEVEKKVGTLVNAEGKKLNKRINELFSYLKTIAQKEASGAGKASKPASKRKSAKGRSAKSGKSSRKASSSKRTRSTASTTTA